MHQSGVIRPGFLPGRVSHRRSVSSVIVAQSCRVKRRCNPGFPGRRRVAISSVVAVRQNLKLYAFLPKKQSFNLHPAY
jgi:hypothetical protein